MIVQIQEVISFGDTAEGTLTGGSGRTGDRNSLLPAGNGRTGVRNSLLPAGKRKNREQEFPAASGNDEKIVKNHSKPVDKG